MLTPRLRYFSGDRKPMVYTEALVEFFDNSGSRRIDTCCAAYVPRMCFKSTDLGEEYRVGPAELPELYDVIDGAFWLAEGWYSVFAVMRLKHDVHRWVPMKDVIQLAQSVELVYRVGSCNWTFVPHQGIMYEPWEGKFIAGCNGSEFSRLIQSKKQYPDHCPACGGAVICSVPQE